MAYSSGTATDLNDLMTKLFTFATANGWTQDQLSTGTGQAAMHKSNLWVSFRWATSSPTALGIYQALGYTGGNQPGQHPNDSGNGFVSGTDANIQTERCVRNIGNGPFPSYEFFLDTGYLYVAVQVQTDVYRHFGFGNLVKTGDWTGGEFVYGHYFNSNSPIDTTTTLLLDGLHTNDERAATLHIEALPNMNASSKWGVVQGQSTLPANDPAGNPRYIVQGGCRAGPIARHFGIFGAGASSGLVDMYQIGNFYWDKSTSFVYFLGFMPDIRGMNIGNFAPRDVVTIGSDDWQVYPSSQKTTANVTNRSYNQGIAYKKVP